MAVPMSSEAMKAAFNFHGRCLEVKVLWGDVLCSENLLSTLSVKPM